MDESDSDDNFEGPNDRESSYHIIPQYESVFIKERSRTSLHAESSTHSIKDNEEPAQEN
jgi:hypothetical protein